MSSSLRLSLGIRDLGRRATARRGNGSTDSSGGLVAAILSGAWRRDPTSLMKSAGPNAQPLSERELAEVAPLLLKSGGAALGWWRIRHSNLRSTPVGQDFLQAYRLHSLQAALKTREIGQILTFLRAKGLDPLLGKGWAIARLYPELGLRPYGDVDLYVRRNEYEAFTAALKSPEADGWHVDLHRGAAELDDRDFDTLVARSQLIRLGDVDVRTFGPEDHLRLLCLHLLREGALRPLWLCDIAAALESLPSDFDWDYFLSGDAKRSEWAVCTLGLAHQILGADLSGVPAARRARQLPAWLAPIVLQQWGVGRPTNGSRKAMADYLRHPAGMIGALRLRWPNPIEATVHLRGSFNERPRLPFQIGACIARVWKFVRQIARPSL